MILNPSVALILDKAADNVTEVAVMPTDTNANGRDMGDYGFDIESAVCHAMIGLDLMDRNEIEIGTPHLTEIMAQVADLTEIPAYDRQAQDAFFLGNGWPLDRVTDVRRRRNDALMWARGLPTDEVANTLRCAADDFRARPAGEGVYNTQGTHERPDTRNGVFAGVTQSMARAIREGHPFAPMFTMALLSLSESVFSRDVHPDPDAGVVVKREDVSAARLAEIAQGVINMLDSTGWTHTYLVNPESGATSTIGATALVVDLPLVMSYINSPLHQTERRWAELWAFVNAVADYAGIAVGDNACPGCGNNHDNPDDRLASWEESAGYEQVVAAITGVRDANITIAASESIGEVSDDDLDLFVRQLFGEGAES